MADFEVKVLRDQEHKRVLQDEGLLTFAVVVGGKSFNQQLSIAEYDTRDKIEARMAEIGAQVASEVGRNKMRSTVPDDILAMVAE